MEENHFMDTLIITYVLLVTSYFWLLQVVQRHLIGIYVITKCPPFDTVSTVQAVVES